MADNSTPVYGRSDVVSFVHENHRHTFDAKNRKAVPNYGDDNRTLPILICAQCRDFACKHMGFNADITKVELTSDEQEYMERFQREGSIETQLMMREAGKALAQILTDSKASKTK